jgi:hypothetical protein
MSSCHDEEIQSHNISETAKINHQMNWLNKSIAYTDLWQLQLDKNLYPLLILILNTHAKHQQSVFKSIIHLLACSNAQACWQRYSNSSNLQHAIVRRYNLIIPWRNPSTRKVMRSTGPDQYLFTQNSPESRLSTLITEPTTDWTSIKRAYNEQLCSRKTKTLLMPIIQGLRTL